MGGRTTYRTLSPKRAPFQTGIDRWPHLRKVPRRRRISHTYSMWLWGHSLFQISSPGPVLHGTKWLLWRPHRQSPTLHSRCGINKGLIKEGSTIDHWRSQCKGWILWPIPYTYIHTHTHTVNVPLPHWSQSNLRSDLENNSHFDRQTKVSSQSSMYNVWYKT
jgi:hypothetical protein